MKSDYNKFFTIVFCSLFFVVCSVPLFAWPVTNGVAICTDGNNQDIPMIVSDGSGGDIITWRDTRNGSHDIYAQRVDSSGVPQWTLNGIAICTAVGDQESPTIISDGSGGAIITWFDSRSGDYNIYAQDIDSSGSILWTPDGVAICTAAGDQINPTITGDGSGGAIISWQSGNATNYDLYAQRVDSSGVTQWTSDGVAICTAAYKQLAPMIVSDGTGGAIITWYDQRSGSYDIYAQAIDSSGVPQWTLDGVALCTAGNYQYYPTLISDGSGGAIVTWYDQRSGSYDIYAQAIDSSGVPQWTPDGVAICTAGNDQINPMIISDGSGRDIITWQDLRNGSDYDIYAQRVDSSGVPQWTLDGVAICTTGSSQYYPMIVGDGSGGSIISWYQGSIGNYDIYAQGVDSSGSILWTPDGVTICTTGNAQTNPMIVSDGSGGAIITWEDYRSGSNYDIYAQSINSGGVVPVELSRFEAMDGIKE